jgi:SpoVK/Ycf46/Vps4 family AAA+-type ATPase
VRLLEKNAAGHDLDDAALDRVVATTVGYSGADVAGLCREAAMGPMRECMVEVQRRAALDSATLETAAAMIDSNSVRPMEERDFTSALRQVRASVASAELAGYVAWNRDFGSFAEADASAAEGASAGKS